MAGMISKSKVKRIIVLQEQRLRKPIHSADTEQNDEHTYKHYKDTGG